MSWSSINDAWGNFNTPPYAPSTIPENVQTPIKENVQTPITEQDTDNFKLHTRDELYSVIKQLQESVKKNEELITERTNTLNKNVLDIKQILLAITPNKNKNSFSHIYEGFTSNNDSGSKAINLPDFILFFILILMFTFIVVTMIKKMC